MAGGIGFSPPRGATKTGGGGGAVITFGLRGACVVAGFGAGVSLVGCGFVVTAGGGVAGRTLRALAAASAFRAAWSLSCRCLSMAS